MSLVKPKYRNWGRAVYVSKDTGKSLFSFRFNLKYTHIPSFANSEKEEFGMAIKFGK